MLTKMVKFYCNCETNTPYYCCADAYFHYFFLWYCQWYVKSQHTTLDNQWIKEAKAKFFEKLKDFPFKVFQEYHNDYLKDLKQLPGADVDVHLEIIARRMNEKYTSIPSLRRHVAEYGHCGYVSDWLYKRREFLYQMVSIWMEHHQALIVEGNINKDTVESSFKKWFEKYSLERLLEEREILLDLVSLPCFFPDHIVDEQRCTLGSVGCLFMYPDFSDRSQISGIMKVLDYKGRWYSDEYHLQNGEVYFNRIQYTISCNVQDIKGRLDVDMPKY